MKKKLCLLSLCSLLVFGITLFAENPKYVFIFIGDGMSVPQRMMAEEYSKQIGNGPLISNSFPHSAMTRTCSADSLITDSAAAATAIACGEKTNNGVLGIAKDGTTRLESCAELAHKHGKKVGIITSVTINHATPAGFYAHQTSRGLYYRIGLDLIASNFEFFGGGGFSGQHDKKDDEQYQGNLYELAAAAGYTVVRDRDALLSLPADTPKTLALYGENILPFAIDNDPNQPTLAQFVEKGIQILSHDAPNGFFMMCEGGAIDYRGHANDAAGNLKEILVFDEAIKVAYEFYKQHPDETLIIITGDHETGGMTIGFAGTGYGLNFKLLNNQKCTPETFQNKLNKAREDKPDFSFSDAEIMLTEWFGFKFEGDVNNDSMVVTPDELQKLQSAYEGGNMGNGARLLLQQKAGIGWSSNNHTAMPVLTSAIGCQSELFYGMLENTDIAQKVKSIL